MRWKNDKILSNIQIKEKMMSKDQTLTKQNKNSHKLIPNKSSAYKVLTFINMHKKVDVWILAV